MNPARAPWRGSLSLLLSLLGGCSTQEVSSLGVYDWPDVRRSDEAGWPDQGDQSISSLAPDAAPAPTSELEDAAPPRSYDAGLDAGLGDVARDGVAGDGLLRCAAPGCRGTAPSSEERRCFDLRAHAFMGDAGYQPGPNNEEYVTFTFDAPSQGPSWLREIAPIIDNQAAVHDIRLYKHAGSVFALGDFVREGVAIGRAPADANFLYAWRPGETPSSFEGAAGIPLGVAFFMLEIHYVLGQGAGRLANSEDTSGVRVCGTLQRPQLPLSFARLASRMPDVSGESRCYSTLRVPIQLLGVLPAPERESPVSAQLFLERSDGRRELIYSTAWFKPPTSAVGRRDELWAFPLPAPLLHPGDELRWSCAYEDGSGDPDPGCALQLLHTPAGGIEDGCEAPPFTPWVDAG